VSATKQVVNLIGRRHAIDEDDSRLAVEQLVIEALERLAPRALEALRQWPDHDEESVEGASWAGTRLTPAVKQWAEKYHPSCPAILQNAARWRDVWKRSPDLARRLYIEKHAGTTILVSSREREFQRKNPFNPPNARRETLEEAIERTKQHYRAHARILQSEKSVKHARDKAMSWDTVSRNCEWFIRVQVLGQRNASVAAKDHTSISVVSRATTAVGWRRGAPAG